MKPVKLLMVASLATLIATGSQAQVAQDVKERVQDRRNLRQDAANVQAERTDADRLSDLVMHCNALRAANAGPQKIANVQADIAAELRHDLKLSTIQAAEAGRKTRQAKQELRSDRRAVRSDIQNVQTDQNSGTPGQVAQEKSELRDDLHDKRDDRRDVVKEAHDLNRTDQFLAQKKDLVAQLCALQKQIDAGGKNMRELQTKREALLQDYLTVSQKEFSLGLRQYVEDRQELREDRRETREDKRDDDH